MTKGAAYYSTLIASSSHTRHSREHHLLAALLDRSILDLHSCDPNIKRTTRNWFRSARTDPFSYWWVCDYLGLCPVNLLKLLNKQENILPLTTRNSLSGD